MKHTDFSLNLYLLRHGVSVSNEQSLVCGAANYALSEKGLLQAKQICENLNQLSFTRIYCSPLTRARQTIEHLHRAVNVTVVPDLVELDTGDVSHITTTELYSKEPRYRYQGLNPHLKYPAGESLNDMMSRVSGWFDNERAQWEEQDSVLIAGHEGTVCALLHHLLRLNISHYPTFVIGNCEYVHIAINSDGQMRYRFIPFEDSVKLTKK